MRILYAIVFTLLALFVGWALVDGQRRAEESQDAAIARCKTLGGHPVLKYYRSTEKFYLTGCKL